MIDSSAQLKSLHHKVSDWIVGGHWSQRVIKQNLNCSICASMTTSHGILLTKQGLTMVEQNVHHVGCKQHYLFQENAITKPGGSPCRSKRFDDF